MTILQPRPPNCWDYGFMPLCPLPHPRPWVDSWHFCPVSLYHFLKHLGFHLSWQQFRWWCHWELKMIVVGEQSFMKGWEWKLRDWRNDGPWLNRALTSSFSQLPLTLAPEDLTSSGHCRHCIHVHRVTQPHN